jgi:hypothetical protein
MTDLVHEELNRLEALEIAAQNLYFGDRSDPALWEAMRVAGDFETKDELAAKLAKQKG